MYQRTAHDLRLRHAGALCPHLLCQSGESAGESRCCAGGQDEHGRVCLRFHHRDLLFWTHPQSHRSGACAGRLFRGKCCCGGGGRVRLCHWDRYRRLHQTAGGLLWCCGTEAHLRTGIQIRIDRLCVLHGPGRSADQGCERLCCSPTGDCEEGRTGFHFCGNRTKGLPEGLCRRRERA